MTLGLQLLYGQDFIVQSRHWNVAEGLPHRNVLNIIEDDQGFIWLGTQNGVCRIEGGQARAFTQNNSRLRNNDSALLFKDHNGNLWIGSPPTTYRSYPLDESNLVDNVDILNPGSLEILSIKDYLKLEDPEFEEKDIRRIEKAHSGLWITSKEKTYYHFDSTLKKITHPTVDEFDFIYPYKNEYIAVQGNSIFHLTKSFERLSTSTIDSDFIVFKIWVDKNESLYFYVRNQINKSDFRIFLIDDLSTFHAQEIFNKGSSKWYHYMFEPFKTDETESYSISRFGRSLNIESSEKVITDSVFLAEMNIKQNSIKDYFVDKSKNIWLISGNGVSALRIERNRFQNLLSRDKEKISTRGILNIDSSRIIINSYRGTFIGNIESEEFEIINTTENEHGFWHGMGFHKEKNQIWTTMQNKIVQINEEGNIQRILTPKSDNEEYVSGFNYFYRDPQTEKFWIGSSTGLFLYDQFQNRITRVIKSGQEEKVDFTVHYIKRFGNHLWACTNKGLLLINNEGSISHQFQFDQIDNTAKSVKHVKEDSSGFLWLSTVGHGIIKWKPFENQYNLFSTDEGLSDNTVHAILEDEFGYYWVPTNNGLNRFNPQNEQFTSFFKENGLSENEFNWLSYAQDDEGNLYFGGLNGVNIVDPALFQDIDEGPKRNVRLIGLDVLGNKGGTFQSKLNEFMNTSVVNIQPNESLIRFNYVLCEAIEAEHHLYGYRIDGLESEWNYTKNTDINLGRLPYGHYTLQIKGKLTNEAWHNNTLDIPLHVHKPIFLQGPFILIGILFLGGLIFGYIKWRTRILHIRNLKLNQEVELRTRELAELNHSKDRLFGILAHDLKTPISSFRGISNKVRFLVQNKEWETLDKMAEQIENNISKMDTLLGNLLPWVSAQMSNPKLEKTKILLHKETEQVLTHFDDGAKQKEVHIINTIKPHETAEIDLNSFYVILNNLVSNALKFTSPSGSIIISSKHQKGQVILSVQDNGVGISQDALNDIFSSNHSSQGTFGEEGHGIGLKLSKDLAIANHCKLKLESNLGKGTKASLCIPK